MNRSFVLVAFCAISSTFFIAYGADQSPRVNASLDKREDSAPKDRRELDDWTRRQQAKAATLVSAVEPLLPPIFEHAANGFGLIETFGASKNVTVYYRVCSTQLRGKALADEITKLFREAQWTEGIPPNALVSERRMQSDGRVTQAIVFHSEPLIHLENGWEFAARSAFVFISDDQTSVECTYSFRYPKT
jgi:hypothetical protein